MATAVRQTAINADLSCRLYHHSIVEYRSNWQERVEQIKRIRDRHTNSSPKNASFVKETKQTQKPKIGHWRNKSDTSEYARQSMTPSEPHNLADSLQNQPTQTNKKSALTSLLTSQQVRSTVHIPSKPEIVSNMRRKSGTDITLPFSKHQNQTEDLTKASKERVTTAHVEFKM